MMNSLNTALAARVLSRICALYRITGEPELRQPPGQIPQLWIGEQFIAAAPDVDALAALIVRMIDKTDDTEQATEVTEEEIAEAARSMGRVRSEAKTAAARENGKKGGRPKGSKAAMLARLAEIRQAAGEDRQGAAGEREGETTT